MNSLAFPQNPATAAQHAQNQGRGNDTMLVHMTPGEVKGLQALAMSHGGSLTTNPQTGLPEAGFLSSILPMALGAGAMMIPGLQGLGAGWIGAGIGGLTALATGSLKKGLMAGLGAYGGAGLTQGLQAAGTLENLSNPAFTPAPVATPTPVTPDIAFNPGVDAVAQTPLPGAPTPTSLLNPQFTSAPVGFMPQTGVQQAVAAAPAAATPVTGMDIFTKGIPALTEKAGREAFMGALPTGTLPAAGATVASAFAPKPPQLGKKQQAYTRPYEFAWNPNEEAYLPSPTPGDTSERRYFSPTFTAMPIEKAPSNTISQGYTYLPVRAADGGLMDLRRGGEMFTDAADEELTYAAGGVADLAKKRKTLKGDTYYKFADDRKDTSMEASVEQNFAAGGLSAALPPRFLSGGGDGMSDSIKANIDGKQEARLADGEFVVPADVVSHLGNGSSKAGAKKLYAMMDKIRKARTGKTRQAPEVNTAKYMPA